MNCYYYYYYEYCILCVSCLLYKVKRISYDYLIIFVRLDPPAKPQTSTKNNNITDTPNLYPIYIARGYTACCSVVVYSRDKRTEN